MRGDELHANAIPFPFGGVGGGIQGGQIRRFQRVGEHGRPENGRVLRVRRAGAAFQPGEQRCVGRGKAVPDFFDIIRRDHLAACGGEIGECRFSQARAGAYAQAAGDQFQNGVAHVGIGCIQPTGQNGGQIGLGAFGQCFDDFTERGRVCGFPRRPDQGSGFGEVADRVVRPAEQRGIGPGFGHGADQAGLRGGESQLAGQGGQRPAAIGVRFGLEKPAHERQFRQAAGG